MQKRFFLSFIAILHFSLPLQANYYPYDKKSPSVSQASFNRYVVSNAKTITRYYYGILEQIHEVNKPLLVLNKKANQLVIKLKDFQKSCPVMTSECRDKLKEIYDKSRAIDRTILLLQKRRMSLKAITPEASKEEIKLKKHSHAFYLKLMGIIDHIGSTNYKLMHYLEEYRLTANTSYSSYFRKKNTITSLSYEILTNTKMALTTMLDKEIQHDFEAVWLQYIDLLESNVIQRRDREFLIRRLEDLNMSWNTFHMKMTKGNYKMPKNIVQTIITMHRHWNSILKIILR